MTKKRILIVEDNDEIRSALEDVLLYENFEVVTACDGFTGLGQLEQGFIPNIILLDVYMPKMDGKKFLDEFAFQFPTLQEKVHILILTAAAAVDIPPGINSANIMIKPIDLDGLLSKLESFKI